MSKPIASLSLDLDNKWSYLKTHGDAGWQSFPTYLDVVVPRVLHCCEQLDVRMTVFVVGQDAALPINHGALRSLADAGHEIGNHSFHHEPWLHLYSEEKLEAEIKSAEDAIRIATGAHPQGFRGPGFSLSETTLRVLARRGYRYDCSTFPTFLGPLARAYYFMTARLTVEEREERKRLFGKFTEGLRPLRPYYWQLGDDGSLLEIPVTTIPWIKTPMHVSYLLYLAQFSSVLAWTYFKFALTVCRMAQVSPSLLLHPLDFMGADDDQELAFFPAMCLTSDVKAAFVQKVLAEFCRTHDVRSMMDHATMVRSSRRADVATVS